MAVEVYINDERLDLFDNVGMGLTFQVGSIFNPNNRAGNLSNKFKVPKTKNNTEILGNLSNINATTEIPYQRNSARVRQDGVELFPNGFAIIEQTTKDYNLTVYSGNVSFFDLIKNRNINELDFGEHHYSITPMINTFDGSEDFIYPIVDYGLNTELLDNSDTQTIDALFPALFAKSIVEKIAEQTGYKVEGSFIDSDVYSRLLFTINQWGYSQEVVDYATNFVFTPVPIDADLPNTPATEYFLDFQNVQSNFWNSVTKEYTPDNTYEGQFAFSFLGSVQSTDANNNYSTEITLRIYEDGVVVLDDKRFYQAFTAFPTAIDFGLFSSNEFNVFKGKKYKASITFGSQTPGTTTRFKVDDGFLNYIPTKDIRYTADIKPSTFYDFSQSDFLKELINMHSLTVQTNDLTKELALNYLDDILDNIGQSLDWSDKIDLSKTPSVKYNLPNYAKENWFRYTKFEEDNTQFADSSLNIDNDNLKQSKDAVVLKTVASNSGLRFENNRCPLAPIQTEIAKAFDKKNNRFLLLNSKDVTVNFDTSINGDTATVNTDIPFAYFSDVTKTDSLDWTNLLNNNYKTLKGILKQSKIVTATFRLTPVDIANLNFLIPIYLDVHTPDININGYFYINKVSNFKKDKSTSVELIRL